MKHADRQICLAPCVIILCILCKEHIKINDVCLLLKQVAFIVM